MENNKLRKILNEDCPGKWEGDNALQGLKIIEKYFPKDKNILQGAEHDIIYSVSIDEIIKSGITREDAEILRSLNWMIENDSLACFV